MDITAKSANGLSFLFLDSTPVMANTTNLNCIFEALSLIPKLHGIEKIQKKTKPVSFLSKKTEEIQENLPTQTTRRLALGFASIALFANSGIGKSLAEENNGFFITGPLPVPSASNNIINKETGTRSFLKKGIYIANIGTKGRMHRLKRYAFDLLALGDLIGSDAWNYVRKYLRIKSTFMYFDFDEVISAAQVNDKQPLMDLANRLFDNVEKLEDAVKQKNLPQTQTCYQETTTILQEVMKKMA
ncbi:PREDICTED: photosynthetic NDH subunit of lumenal location 3, chloroplastic [Nicotiana attenuata]|uniref:Photosynthetic ndh subunit of lumenal location 3, chloroplastic n=1 Tax=Nicotiana attenuata TaxID=49451 RepID=A0A1J6I2J2_NICAT|nr:PREDICTED: photosynthetic NDH subunit of lumenal location 3, chloroplastic [Nicotiana attenuata]OIS98739.1 photosynthetic ndh subunit of lumenal location 3, chloroplastic [Nicotiana attenuata]